MHRIVKSGGEKRGLVRHSLVAETFQSQMLTEHIRVMEDYIITTSRHASLPMTYAITYIFTTCDVIPPPDRKWAKDLLLNTNVGEQL